MEAGAAGGRKVRVAAGILERDGRILICRRASGDSHPGKWEFPGGKIEAGEAPEEALARELEEELGVRARVGPQVAHVHFGYPGGRGVELLFYRVLGFEGEPRNRVFGEIRWERREALSKYDFLEADRPLVKFLAGG